LILETLQKDFHFNGATIVPSYPKHPEEDRFRPKSKRSLVIGQFEEREEIRVEVGEITLLELLKRDAVYFITHPYNSIDGTQVETTIKQIRMFGDLLQSQNARIKQFSLVTPVGPYDLNHSIKRKLREGLVEGRGLKIFLEDLASAGYNEIITIGPHSNKTKEIANDLGIYFRGIDPFRTESMVSSPHLGPFFYKTASDTEKKDDYSRQMARLTPFITWVKDNFGQSLTDVYFVATDDGSESTIEQITYSCRRDKQHILAILKDRSEPSRIKICGVKSSSTAQLDDIRGKTCILADDRRLSGRTINEIAYSLKNDSGAGKVVAMLAHDLSYDEVIRDHTSVDQFVFLETNPGSHAAQIKDDPRLVRLPMETTALLLAAEIYDSYVNLRDRGELKVR